MKLPTHRRHASGLGVVRLNGHDYYTKAWGSREAEKRYDQLIATWLANGRRMPDRDRGMLVEEAVDLYLKTVPQQRAVPRLAMEAVLLMFGDMPVAQFGRNEFRLVRSRWSKQESRTGGLLSLATIRNYQSVVKGWVHWMADEGIIDPERVPIILSLSPFGRDHPNKGRKVDPVSDETIAATTAAMVRRQLVDLILFIRHAGCRPGEACMMRPRDIDRSGTTWYYRPKDHKTAHRGKTRSIPLGPRCRQILERYLPIRKDDETVFRTQMGNPYTPNTIRQNIAHACSVAGVPMWTPNQLRHTRATEIRRTHGIEGSRAVLGHSNLKTTEFYAEIDETIAANIAEETG